MPGYATQPLSRAGVDDLVELGAYPQSSGGRQAPIRWRVLDRSDAGVLLLSDRIIDCRRYHDDFVATTWRDCDLRAWLNSEFCTAAFGDRDRALLEPSACTDNGNGAPDTVDSVFLLSVEEVRTLTSPSGDGLPRRSAISTEYARAPKADGCHLYVYDKGVEEDYVVEDGARYGCSWWWTRTQLQTQDGRSPRAAFVGPRGDVKSYGRVDLARYGVRPAVRVRPEERGV